jgi:hypothetical protein
VAHLAPQLVRQLVATGHNAINDADSVAKGHLFILMCPFQPAPQAHGTRCEEVSEALKT